LKKKVVFGIVSNKIKNVLHLSMSDCSYLFQNHGICTRCSFNDHRDSNRHLL